MSPDDILNYIENNLKEDFTDLGEGIFEPWAEVKSCTAP